MLILSMCKTPLRILVTSGALLNALLHYITLQLHKIFTQTVPHDHDNDIEWMLLTTTIIKIDN